MVEPFHIIQIIYWLSLSTWFGGVLFIAVAAPIVFRTSLVAAALTLLRGGVVFADAGGIPVCTTQLAVCNTGLATCATSLTQAQGNASTCSTNLNTCTADLSTCNTDAAVCAAQLTQCQGQAAGAIAS